MTDRDDDDPEPFVLAGVHSASRNPAMIQKLEARLRELGLDEGEIEDRCTSANERWDASAMRRAQAWYAWARRHGIAKIRTHTTMLCGGRVEATKLDDGYWRCRLCGRTIPTDETAERDITVTDA